MDNSHAVSHGSTSPISSSSREIPKKNDNNDRSISYSSTEQAPVRSGIPPSLTLGDRWELLKRFNAKELLGMSSDTRTNPTDVEHGNGMYEKRWTVLPNDAGYDLKPLPAKLSADEQHITVWPLGRQSTDGHLESIETSPLGQHLYGQGYRHTSHGLQRFDGAKPYAKQPDINAALKEIDRLSTAGLLKLRMLGGAGGKKQVRWSSLPKNPFMSDEKKSEKKFEKALGAWIAEGRGEYSTVTVAEWDDIETSLRDSYNFGVLDMRKWAPIPPSYVNRLTQNLDRVNNAYVSVPNATHVASSFSVLANLRGLFSLDLEIVDWSSDMFENSPRLENVVSLKLSGSSLPGPEKGLATVAKFAPNLVALNWTSKSNLTDISENTDADCSVISQFPHLRHLCLNGINITNASLRAIKNIKNLEHLILSQTSINDEAAPDFEEMKNLHTLSVEGANVSDKVMKAIASLPKISVLDIEGTSISSEGISNLANCSLKFLYAENMKTPCKIDEKALSGSIETLEMLNLDTTSTPDWAIAYLGEFKKLSDLTVGGKAVSDESIKSLKSLPLSELELYEPAISNEAAESIQHFTGLKKCTIINAAVSDRFLSAFEAMEDLEYLNLSGANITDLGIRQWKDYLAGSKISSIHLDETLITEGGLNTILSTGVKEVSARNCQLYGFPEKLREFARVNVDLRGIEFDASTLQSLRSLKNKNVQFDDPDKRDDGQKVPTVSEDATNTNSHWQAMMDRFNPALANQEASRKMSVATYHSYPEEVKSTASVRSEMKAMRQLQIESQMDEIYLDAACSVYYREANRGIRRAFSIVMACLQGVGNYSVKMDIQTPGSTVTNVLDAFGAQVPGIGVVTSSVNEFAEAYGIRNFNQWCEGVSRLLDVDSNVDMFADTLARAMTLWYKNDLHDAKWVAKNSDQTKYVMQVRDFVKGIGQSYTKHERHIMHLVERKLNWLFNQLGRPADEDAVAKEGEVNLATAINESVEAERDKLEKRQGKQKQTEAQSGNARLVLIDTDHLKIQPIMEALVRQFPRQRQDALPKGELSQELAKVIVWGNRDKMIPLSEVSERTMQKLAKTSASRASIASNLTHSIPVLTEEPQSMEEQGESELQLTIARQNATIEEQSSIIAKHEQSIETLENTVAKMQKQMDEMKAFMKNFSGKQ